MIAMGSTRQDLRLTSIVVAVTFIIIFLMVSAVGNDSVTLYGYSAVLYCAAMCVGIQWAAWIPASIMKTERFYDLIGCLTFLTVVGFSLWAGSQSESPSLRELIVSLLVVIWSLRLSSFLFPEINIFNQIFFVIFFILLSAPVNYHYSRLIWINIFVHYKNEFL